MADPKRRFDRILLGVDLADEDRYVGEELSASTREAVQRAVWLAKVNSAELCFFCVLPEVARQLSSDTQVLLAEQEIGARETVLAHATAKLASIADSAAQHGTPTSSKVALGISWIEIIREVLRHEYDLVVVGTRNKGPFRRMLFGDTGIKLLRKCPCAVWAAKPQQDERIASILVAHDLTPVGELALELGCWLARKQGSALHVLHAIEETRDAAAGRELTVEAAEERIRGQLESANPGKVTVRIDVVKATAEEAILSQVDDLGIQLVVMGTIGRSGISGFMVGNTAEKVLPFLPSSVLAVKPAGFRSPVELTEDESEAGSA